MQERSVQSNVKSNLVAASVKRGLATYRCVVKSIPRSSQSYSGRWYGTLVKDDLAVVAECDRTGINAATSTIRSLGRCHRSSERGLAKNVAHGVSLSAHFIDESGVKRVHFNHDFNIRCMSIPPSSSADTHSRITCRNTSKWIYCSY